MASDSSRYIFTFVVSCFALLKAVLRESSCGFELSGGLKIKLLAMTAMRNMISFFVSLVMLSFIEKNYKNIEKNYKNIFFKRINE